ncbi:glycosyltransferase [Limosilactobacillus reuteri]|jgi:rhamnosyltransferase|uniref:glycosyltransferase n=1 Tax=Limosilactobacillus reuteri TaxID=1598 RepID=UPI000A2D2098|nr:glycosyltransferase [Limosilactobacillus reuteri]OTA48785.1 hypothetical protein BHL90_08880 [Limosilactobacillus reuteri]
MDKIGCLIVTFNPSLDGLIKNLNACSTQIEDILIVDNGSSNIKEIEELKKTYNIHIYKLIKNIGIAGAQNKGFKILAKKGFNWILTLDQDSEIPRLLISAFTSCGKMVKDTGIITPAYIDENWSKQKKKSVGIEKADFHKISEKKLVISSGNLVNVRAWERVNGFDEKLFIDLVDFDFNTKLRLAGYKIYQLDNIYIQHSIGSSIKRNVLGKLLFLPDISTTSDHAPMRQYYIYRNSIIFYKRYAKLYKKRFLVLRTVVATRRIFLYKDRAKKFSAAFKGIIAGQRYSPKKDKKFQKTMNLLQGGEQNQ